nr:BTAD domain-containing putative transcriptional regulator [Micromonospora citrea]
MVGRARADGDPLRLRRLRETLALWRGAAMQDVGLPDSAAFRAAVTRLDGLRLTTISDRTVHADNDGHPA